MKPILHSRPGPLLGALLLAIQVLAVGPDDVQHRLDAGEKITLIDLRATALFQQSHIPGAINVPAHLCASKKLPPLGRVIVYDDGVSPAAAADAAAILSRKPGIQAEVLEGGLPAWEMNRGGTTRARGLDREPLPRITFDQLKQLQSEQTVLIDLRRDRSPEAVATQSRASSARTSARTATRTDLRAEFPKARHAASPFDPQSAQADTPGPAAPPLYVLIDAGDGAAERMARALKAGGVTRFAILIGGEHSLSRQGQPGLQRRGLDLTVESPASTPSTLNP